MDGTSKGRVLNRQSIYETAHIVFNTKEKTEMAVAIALAESGGKTDARNTNTDGSVDRGLWQINNKWHPEVSDACADSPSCAALAAYRISKHGTDWSAWSTYKNGAYKSYVGDTDLNADSGFLGSGIGSPSGLPNPLDAMTRLANAIEKFVNGLFSSDTWFRIGKVVLGLILVVFGIVNLMPGTIKKAAKVAGPAAALAAA